MLTTGALSGKRFTHRDFDEDKLLTELRSLNRIGLSVTIAFIEVERQGGKAGSLSADTTRVHRYLKSILPSDEILRCDKSSFLTYSETTNAEVYKVRINSKLITVNQKLRAKNTNLSCTLRFVTIAPTSSIRIDSLDDLTLLISNTPVYTETDKKFEAIFESYKQALKECTAETEIHCYRLSIYNQELATELNIPEDEVIMANMLGWLHDIGKIAIEDAILNKPAALTDLEWQRMTEHPTIGWRILKDLPGFSEIASGVRHHHERYDGRGYPDRLIGSKIPYLARMMTVTDSFDAILSKRVYKPAQTLEYALSELQKHRGTQFDPDIVDKFVALVHEGRFDQLIKNY